MFRFFAILGLCVWGSVATAGDRIALVVGNAVYGSVGGLDNPANDASLIAATLERLGFKVTVLIDATQVTMKRGIAQFGRELRAAGSDATGLFYYAGHGVQSFGTNYLLPVDTSLSDAADLDLVAVEAQSVLRQMYSARNQTNIVILDACRNNPFSDIPDFTDSGLAEMQAPTGTFLAYATAPGGVALDGLAGNSPFTSAVVDQMNVPGVPIERMFRNVRVSVLETTQGQQTPWDASSLTSEFMFRQAAAPQPSIGKTAEESWRSAQSSGDAVEVMLFLRAFPDSPFAGEARQVLSALLDDTVYAGRPEASGTADAPAEAPVADTVDPSPSTGLTDEERMFAAARADGSRAGYEAYLLQYPDGVFAARAQTELSQLASAPSAGATERLITYSTPLVSDIPQLSGRSIAQVVAASPLFPPIEGLPEPVWQNKPCSTCHQWTTASLCEQATRYLSQQSLRALAKPHPFGGSFKQALRQWATGGCK